MIYTSYFANVKNLPSKERYVGNREANGAEVCGYLVKTKTGELHGILNEKTHYQELGG